MAAKDLCFMEGRKKLRRREGRGGFKYIDVLVFHLRVCKESRLR